MEINITTILVTIIVCDTLIKLVREATQTVRELTQYKREKEFVRWQEIQNFRHILFGIEKEGGARHGTDQCK